MSHIWFNIIYGWNFWWYSTSNIIWMYFDFKHEQIVKRWKLLGFSSRAVGSPFLQYLSYFQITNCGDQNTINSSFNHNKNLLQLIFIRLICVPHTVLQNMLGHKEGNSNLKTWMSSSLTNQSNQKGLIKISSHCVTLWV